MKYLIILSILISTSVSAKRIFSDQKLINELLMSKHRGISISCKSEKCIAKEKINSTTKSALKKVYVGPNGVNPTAPFCRVIKGNVRVYYFENKDAVSVCLFKDESFLLTWDLFNQLTQ